MTTPQAVSEERLAEILSIEVEMRDQYAEGSDAGAADFNGDVYYRNGVFKAFWMGQRKGLFWCNTVSVCRADEPAVLAFLQPRLDYLHALWSPLAALPHTQDKGDGE